MYKGLKCIIDQLDCHSASSAGPNRIKNFKFRDFQDGIFWDEMSLKLLSWDFTKKKQGQDLLGYE